ncbi:hypothetical protein VDBG_01510 [Verticillium alfalfae VaMs.102]|uniref:Uncharacterized protein n=1 Tax=Verticillium alfalfae (strain VaMs.102 / ATCC MYA-4576 / FGSC 10136) TaxID=526221 RepID=C9SAC4_VERA1|nr:hypothetical protein VDBG_01510 [Verticillium alfalfae VaMs.102]EEY15401.1 hypothetical protein VDBG_01510 [Verticillium alfalfae VaMs.102]
MPPALVAMTATLLRALLLPPTVVLPPRLRLVMLPLPPPLAAAGMSLTAPAFGLLAAMGVAAILF